MAFNIAYPDVNGKRTSYCSIEFTALGLKLIGCRSINYRETNEITKIRGTSGKPIGRTRAIADFEGDIEIYQKEWLQLVDRLTRGGAVGFAEEGYPIACSYSEGRTDTVTDRLFGVIFHSPESSASEGTDAQVIRLQMNIMDIIWANRYQGVRIRR